MAKWIKAATSQHKGAFGADARRHGESTHAFAEEHKSDSGVRGKRARLALTLMGMHHGGHHEQPRQEHRPLSRVERRFGRER